MSPEVTPDFKSPKRIVDPRAGMDKVAAEGRCRACGKLPTGHPLDSLNRAHLVPRSRGGDDVPANIIPLCGSGTSGCHGLSHEHHVPTLRAIRRALKPEEVAYVIAKTSRAWLDRSFPA